jgi:hypothetical protein
MYTKISKLKNNLRTFYQIYDIIYIVVLMKKFRKDKNKLFICEECGKLCKDKTVLSIHNIKIHKLNPREYFNKWIKEEGEGICKICGNETELKRSDKGYTNTCSKKCKDLYVTKRTEEEVFKKYEVCNVYQSEEIKLKCRKTKLEKYGDEKYQNREQIEKTNLMRYGSKTPLKNIEIQLKTQKNGILSKKFKNLWYQGSYELDFLTKYYDNFSDIKRGPTIKYILDGNMKNYYSDFYIPSLNLIIEIKNSYLLKRDQNMIREKEQAVLKKGFNYIMILDKNYEEFCNFFQNL